MVDAGDLKSPPRKGVRVRVPLLASAPNVTRRFRTENWLVLCGFGRLTRRLVGGTIDPV
jgi:hypothetical protein